MSQQQLAQLFPDGKTLHLPSNGKPLPGYEQAKAEILARNATLAAQASAGSGPSIGGLFASLFGSKSSPPAPPADAAPPSTATMVASADPESIEEIAPAVPLPPQRPKEIQVATIALPDQVSDAVAAIVEAPAPRVLPGPDPVLGYDEQGAVKALFDPRAAFLDLGFTSRARDELSVTQFTGPAVKPLPMIEPAQAEL